MWKRLVYLFRIFLVVQNCKVAMQTGFYHYNLESKITQNNNSEEEASLKYGEAPFESLPASKKEQLPKSTEDPYYQSERRHWIDEPEEINSKHCSIMVQLALFVSWIIFWKISKSLIKGVHRFLSEVDWETIASLPAVLIFLLFQIWKNENKFPSLIPIFLILTYN